LIYTKKIIDAGFNLEIESGNLIVQPASKLTPEQRQFICQHKVEILEELRHSPDCVDDLKECGNSNLKELDILDSETWKHPRPELLIESELEAFHGWYGVMINPSQKYGAITLSHEEATHLAWKFLMDSMKNQHREGRGRYAPKE
jgi:hypothetical protein